jgi:tetratricopeptide (TPR) repeat protein
MVLQKQLSNSKKLVADRIIDTIAEGKFATAQTLIKKNFKPNSYFFNFFNGWMYQLKGNHPKAIKLFEQALLINPISEDCLNGLAGSYLELKMIDQAEECSEQARLLNPKSEASNLIFATIIASKYKNNAVKQIEALAILDDIIHNGINPTAKLDATIATGAIYLDIGKYQAAKFTLEDVLEKDPYNIPANKNLISVYSNLLEIDKAISCTKIVQMSEDPEQANDAMYQEGMLELLKGNYVKGWRLHEARLVSSRANNIISHEIPIWDGRPVDKGSRLLVTHEQGLGDLLHFLRYIPLLKDKFSKIDLEIRPNTYNNWQSGQEPPSLKSLIADKITVDNILIKGWDKVKESDYDLILPIMSVPFALRTGKNIPNKILFGSKNTNTKWDVAINWKGSKHHFNDKHRSMSEQHLLQILNSNPDLKFVSLNIDPTEFSVDNFTQDMESVSTVDKLLNTVLSSKLVLTVDSMVAHLAGGTNIPTIVMQPYSPDWRWGLTSSDCIWYDNVTNIRQTKINNWDAVIEEVNTKLSQI